jgi:thiol-disulfide isomerase/thioredoxin
MEEEIQGQMIEMPAPPFVLNDLDGNTIRLTDFKGKIVILYFWATWCGPCIAGFPALQKSVDKYKGDDMVKFLFIDVLERGDNAKKRAKDLINKNNYTFHVLFDEDSCSVTSAYKVSSLPNKFFIDPEGIIRFGGRRSKYEIEVIEEIDIKMEMLR